MLVNRQIREHIISLSGCAAVIASLTLPPLPPSGGLLEQVYIDSALQRKSCATPRVRMLVIHHMMQYGMMLYVTGTVCVYELTHTKQRLHKYSATGLRGMHSTLQMYSNVHLC